MNLDSVAGKFPPAHFVVEPFGLWSDAGAEKSHAARVAARCVIGAGKHMDVFDCSGGSERGRYRTAEDFIEPVEKF